MLDVLARLLISVDVSVASSHIPARSHADTVSSAAAVIGNVPIEPGAAACEPC